MPQYLLSCGNNDLNRQEKKASSDSDANQKAAAHIIRTKTRDHDCTGLVTWERIGSLKRIQLFFTDLFSDKKM